MDAAHHPEDKSDTLTPSGPVRIRGDRIRPTPCAHVGCEHFLVTPHVGGVANTNADTGGHTEAGTVAGSNAHATTDANTGAGGNLALSKLDAVVLRTQTKEALIGLGWKTAIANAAAASAFAAGGAEATLERLIFHALRRCPQRTG